MKDKPSDTIQGAGFKLEWRPPKWEGFVSLSLLEQWDSSTRSHSFDCKPQSSALVLSGIRWIWVSTAAVQNVKRFFPFFRAFRISILPFWICPLSFFCFCFITNSLFAYGHSAYHGYHASTQMFVFLSVQFDVFPYQLWGNTQNFSYNNRERRRPRAMMWSCTTLSPRGRKNWDELFTASHLLCGTLGATNCAVNA